MLFASLEEARLLVDAEDAASAAHNLAEAGPNQVVIKQRAQGCFALLEDVEYSVPAVPATVVDAVGAGDAFVAGYLAELVNDRKPADRLRLAVQTRAFACETAGDWEGMPFRHELELLNRADPVVR